MDDKVFELWAAHLQQGLRLSVLSRLAAALQAEPELFLLQSIEGSVGTHVESSGQGSNRLGSPAGARGIEGLGFSLPPLRGYSDGHGSFDLA